MAISKIIGTSIVCCELSVILLGDEYALSLS